MKKNLSKKLILSFCVLVMAISLLPSFSFAKSEKIQMIQKSKEEYIIYISNLLNNKFEFAFANKADEAKENLNFSESAMDKSTDGNNIAYIDTTIYSNYFNEKPETYLWVKQGTEYKIEAEKVNLADAITEQDIKELNNITKKIPVKFGNLELSEETTDGVKVKHKMGTINVDSESKVKYSYQMVKSEPNSEVANFISLADEINKSEEKNMFEKISTYNKFKDSYAGLVPNKDDEKWQKVENDTIKQPQDSKDGEQYLVWIKSENDNDTIIDVQIMTCHDEYTPEYESKKVIEKEVTKMPITGESLALYITAAVLIVLIAIVIVIKLKNDKLNKNE